jgi:hypothetical protein
LITGGYGDIGIKVAEWLAMHGAGTIMLLGRKVSKSAISSLQELATHHKERIQQI